jgi:glycosyltransferase involved in cell wall biosynthesis
MVERRPVIAVVTDAIAPYHRGGKEQRYLELTRRLAGRAEVHVYTMKWWDGKNVRRDGGVTYHAISPLMSLYSGTRRSIWQATFFAVCCLRLLTRRFDVIEADHMPYLPLLSLKLVALVRRSRLVVTWHECWGREYWRTYLGLRGCIGWMCESLATRLPNTIIAASPETATRLRAVTRDRIPVIVAPNGIDLELIDTVDRASDAAEIIAVGRLLPHKRIDLLLEAIAILRADGRILNAHVVGTGPQLARLSEQARALGVQDTVTFRQDVETSAELFGLLKGAKVAVFPSEREGFGIAVLEALACGIPVITTSAPDNLARHLVAGSAAGGIVCEPSAPALAETIGAVLDGLVVVTPPDTGWLRRYDWAAVTENVAAALS